MVHMLCWWILHTCLHMVENMLAQLWCWRYELQWYFCRWMVATWRFVLFKKLLGSVLCLWVCESPSPNHIWRCEPPKRHNYINMFNICSKLDKAPNEGHGHKSCPIFTYHLWKMINLGEALCVNPIEFLSKSISTIRLWWVATLTTLLCPM
jgi:hypothetical protein